MASEPLTRLVLAATSVVDELGFVALADLSGALQKDASADYRIIGGHMVTVLVARWGLGADLYRETGDTDLGVPPALVRDLSLVDRLQGIGYRKVAGNRFARSLDDVPMRLGDDKAVREAVIDVLVPAYTSRPRSDRRIGDDLVTTEVPGLAFALARPPITLDLAMRRLNGEILDVALTIADEVGALVLKALATTVRSKDTDIVDVWRCLEVGYAAGLGPRDFDAGAAADAAATVRRLFESRDGPGIAAIVREQRLSTEAADARFTRIRALAERVLG